MKNFKLILSLLGLMFFAAACGAAGPGFNGKLNPIAEETNQEAVSKPQEEPPVRIAVVPENPRDRLRPESSPFLGGLTGTQNPPSTKTVAPGLNGSSPVKIPNPNVIRPISLSAQLLAIKPGIVVAQTKLMAMHQRYVEYIYEGQSISDSDKEFKIRELSRHYQDILQPSSTGEIKLENFFYFAQVSDNNLLDLLKGLKQTHAELLPILNVAFKQNDVVNATDGAQKLYKLFQNYTSVMKARIIRAAQIYDIWEKGLSDIELSDLPESLELFATIPNTLPNDLRDSLLSQFDHLRTSLSFKITDDRISRLVIFYKFSENDFGTYDPNTLDFFFRE